MRTILALPLLFAVCYAASLPQIPQGKAWKGKEKKQTAVKQQIPRFENGRIVCGNKLVEFTSDGAAKITSGGKLLGTVKLYYVIRRAENYQKADWGSFTPAHCSYKIEGNKVIWNLVKERDGVKWQAAKQELEILPDGLIKFSAEFMPPEAKGWVLNRSNAIWVLLPSNSASREKMIFNGRTVVPDVNGKQAVGDWKSKSFNYQLYSANPADTFKIFTDKKHIYSTSLVPYPTQQNFRQIFAISYPRRDGTIFIDLREAPELKVSADTRAGVDFRAVENMGMPAKNNQNLLMNSSFERGLDGWRAMFVNRDRQYGWKPIQTADGIAYSGNRSMKLSARAIKDVDYRRLVYGVNAGSPVVPSFPGKYTLSFYAKCSDNSKASVNCWFPSRHKGGNVHVAFSNKARGAFAVTPQWKRYTLTIDNPYTGPLELFINAWSTGKKDCDVYIDAIQIERGSKATAYSAAPVEGKLLTSSPDNFVSDKAALDAKLEIFTAKPGTKGKVAVTVKDFYGEVCKTFKADFASGKDGRAVVSLPFNGLDRRGVFVVKADYTLADGTVSHSYHRFARVVFMNNTHRLRNLFGATFSSPENNFKYYTLLDRYRKLGVGGKGHHYTYEKKVWDTEREYGIVPYSAFLMSFVRDKSTWKRIGFALVDGEKRGNVYVGDPNILALDYHLSGDGKPTEAWVAKIREACKTLAAKNKHIPLWLFSGETVAGFPYDWWSKEGTADKFAEYFALALKGFVEGIKAGNPDAMVCPDDPNNMRPDSGIKDMERVIKACNKIGVKFDVLAIHPYRYKPEAPDLDADTQTLFKMLSANDYGKVKILWSEMMHWGPFNIPQWGVQQSNWVALPDFWSGGLLSYDMGWTEKKSASWYARAFLVALKYSDRILHACAGNMYNNFGMDLKMTPYAAQLVPNTLSNLLGDSKFVKDIRFAPYLRTYVFEDAQKRPVAAVWCHLDKVDEGSADAPVIEADFGSALEGVYDMMYTARKFSKGKMRFAVSGMPLFFRGKAGSTGELIEAFENAAVISGEGMSPIGIAVNPANEKQMRVTLKNFLSRPFECTIEGKQITVPASGSADCLLPLDKTLKRNALVSCKAEFEMKTGKRTFMNKLPFTGFAAAKIADDLRINTVNWDKIPAIRIPYTSPGYKGSGSFKLAWNRAGIFIEIKVKDNKFCHVEYPVPAGRWLNDCAQIYIDTMADARERGNAGFDENDYSYALFPNAKGDGARVFRYRSVEPQIGLANVAPPDMTFADDIPCTFSSKNGVLTYRVFFPQKYTRPIQLAPGSVFGFGLFVPDSDAPRKYEGALTTDREGKSGQNRPHMYPAAVLVD